MTGPEVVDDRLCACGNWRACDMDGRRYCSRCVPAGFFPRDRVAALAPAPLLQRQPDAAFRDADGMLHDRGRVSDEVLMQEGD